MAVKVGVVVLAFVGKKAKKRKGRGIYEIIAKNQTNRVIRNNDNNETRQTFETCQKYDKYALNPIIDWSDYEVWEFIRAYKLKYNPLYDKGYKRVGCVGCPMSSRQKQEFNYYPKFKANYIRACQKFVDSHKDIAERLKWRSGEDMFAWWVSGKAIQKDSGQMTFEDYMEDIYNE